MFDLYKMNFYRLLRTKSFYIVTIIATFYCFMETMMTIIGGMVASDFIAPMSNFFAADCFKMFIFYISSTQMGPLIFVGIFWAMFSAADYSNGYIKNVIVFKKEQIYIAKYLTFITYITFMYVWFLFVVTVTTNIFANKVSFNFNIVSFLVVLFMFYALGTVLFMTAYLSFKTSFTIMMTFMISIGFSQLLCLLIEYFCEKLGFEVRNLDRFLLSCNMDNISEKHLLTPGTHVSISNVGACLLIASVYLVLSHVIAFMSFKKKDIVV